MTDWTTAACRGLQHLFFGAEHEGHIQRRHRLSEARILCSTCPVSEACAELGYDEPFGLWAGINHEGRGDERSARFIDPRCGTNAGYTAHCRANEPACTECKGANRRYNADRRAAIGRPRRGKAWVVMSKRRRASVRESVALRAQATTSTEGAA